MKFCRTDARSIFSQIKCQEKQMKLKRRWLLGIPTSRSERKKLKKIFKNRYLPESLLREDDIFYESVRTHVEGTFGAHHIERENHIPHDDAHLIQKLNIKRLILSCLGNLTTKGLYLLALIITGGSSKSEITRGNLKKIIKGSLSSVLDSKSHNHHQLETRKQLFQLLTNPQHFRDGCELPPALRSQSYHAAVAKVLVELQNLPSQTLIAMRGKLKGVKAPMPQLQQHKHGWARDHLIKLVKKMSEDMLSRLEGIELQEPLAKAMAVADLSLRLKTGCHNIFSKEFFHFSPEVKSLQSDIMNAIWSVKNVVTVQELRDLQLLIEPKAVISNRALRTAFVNFLTDFLFECNDMESIPQSLLQILDVINRDSKRATHNVSFQKKFIEEEVDCILSVGAQTKQIVLDLLPDDEFDQDFTDAYMVQLEESDEDEDEDVDDDDIELQEERQFINGEFNSIYSNYESESIGSFVPIEFHPSATMIENNVPSCSVATSEWLNGDSENLPHMNCDTVNSESQETNTRDATNLYLEETERIPTKYNACKNHYLAIQDVCDKTSMLAYNLIGHMLEDFAVGEGLDLNLKKKLYLGGKSN